MLLETDVKYFAYIMFGPNNIHYIRLNDNEAIKTVMRIRIGDALNIKGLGYLKVANIHSSRHPFREEGSIWHEIGITCSRFGATV